MTDICFIGAGRMAEAIISAALSNGVSPKRIIAADIIHSRLKYLRKKYKIITRKNNVEAVKKAEIIFLCTKPQQFNTAAEQIKNHIAKGWLVISIAAGITLKNLETFFPNSAIIRTMPNTSLMQGCGVVGFSRGRKTTARHIEALKKILGKSALLIQITENKMNALTAISGSGTAYVFYLAEAMLCAARKFGFDKKTAEVLVNRTIFGASKMLLNSQRQPAELRKDVTSHGGTTEAAISFLSRMKWDCLLTNAMQRAKNRAAELSL